MTDPKIGERLKEIEEMAVHDDHLWGDPAETCRFLLHHLNELRRLAQRCKDDYNEQGFVETDHMTAMECYLEELNGND